MTSSQNSPTAGPSELNAPLVVAVAGPIMSGTSLVTKNAALAAPAPRASFGDHLRKETGSADRYALAEAGQNMVDTDAKAFARAVLERSGWQPERPLIVDGVRHVEILRSLQDLVFPVPVVLAYIDVTPAVYAKRIEAEGKLAEALNFSDHPTEQQVTTRLTHLADFRVDNSGDVDEAVRSLIAHSENRLQMRRSLENRILFPDFEADPGEIEPGTVAVIDMRAMSPRVRRWLDRLQKAEAGKNVITVAIVDDFPSRKETANTTLQFFLPRPVRYAGTDLQQDKAAVLAAEIEIRFPVITAMPPQESKQSERVEGPAAFWLTMGERAAAKPTGRSSRPGR